MKKLFSLMLILTAPAFSGCKKDAPPPPPVAAAPAAPAPVAQDPNAVNPAELLDSAAPVPAAPQSK